MKKSLLVFAAVLLCLSLAACNSDHAPTETNGTGMSEPGGFTEVEKPDTLPVSGWVADTGVSTEPYAFTEDGFYHIMNGCLCYTDTTVGNTVFLCSKPGCLHGEADSGRDRAKCDANVNGLVCVMFYHGETLYYATFEDENGYQLYARNPDGTGLRSVDTLCGTLASSESSAQIGSWALSCGDLYYTVQVDRITEVEEDVFTYDNSMIALARYDLSAGKEELLLSVEDSFLGICGVNDDMVILWMSYLPTAEEMMRPDYKEYEKQFPAYLRLWHEEGGGVSTLCEMDRSATKFTIGFANGKLHFNGGEGTKRYAYDLASMTFGDSDLPADANRIWSEKYVAAYWQGYYDLESGTFLTNEYDTMQLPAGIDQFGASPEGFGEQGFVIHEFYSKNHRGVFENFVYIPYEKMNDGMQLSDRILFMRHDDDGYHLIQPEG